MSYPYIIPEIDPEDGEELYGSLLLGPDSFRCYLGEPEDRNWYRDGSDAVIRLNDQHNALEAKDKRIAELEGVINRAGGLALQKASHELIRQVLAETLAATEQGESDAKS